MGNGDWGWSDRLSTAITFLDDEHRNLAEHYLRLNQDAKGKTNLHDFTEDFKTLLENTRAHFAHEERVMRNINYPHYYAHKTAHDRLVDDFSDFLKNIGEGFVGHDLHALAEFFKYWFLDHVRDYDVQLRRFIDRSD